MAGIAAPRSGSRGVRLAARVIVALVVSVLALVAYTVWDDARLVVSTVTITHEQLPSSFDGFRIVQVSDLHSKRFGVGQRDLLAAIAAAKPDLVLLTGDYTDALSSPAGTDLSPVAELVGGLPDGVPVYYVLGNWDARGAYGAGPEVETALVDVLESNGARPVYPYVELSRGGGRIWLTDWAQAEFRTEAAMRAALEDYLTSYGRDPGRATTLYEAWWARQQQGHDPSSEFDIAVTHRPMDFPDYDAELARSAREYGTALTGIEGQFTAAVDWDVNIAGHTHGGQFRLPFVGALVSPEGRLLPGSRFIDGLHTDVRGRVTYISKGLGAGGQFPPLRFRFLNTPELSVIVLRRGAAPQ